MADVAVTLNDVDITSSLLDDAMSVSQALGQRWRATVYRNTSGAVVGHRVGVYFGGARLFGGTVEEVIHEVEHLTATGTTINAYRLECVSWERRLDSKIVREGVFGQVFYADDAANVFSSQYHTLADGQKVRLRTSGTLPGGLAESTTYFVRDATAHTFKLAATLGGTAIDIADAGLGTHRFLWLARDVVIYLVSTYASGEGIDLLSGDIDDGDFLEQIVISHNQGVTVSAALDSIAGTCGFIWFINPEVALHFKTRSTTAAPWAISNNTIQAEGFALERSRLDYVNRQKIVGSFLGLDPLEETFTGDGTAVQWWLTQRAEVIESITLDGEPVTLGTDGVETGVQFYWSPGEFNLRAESAPANGASLVVRYRKLGSNVYEVEDTAEQSARAAIEGGTGIYESIVDDSASIDALGSVAKAQARLDEYKALADEVRYAVKIDAAANLLQVGQLQTINITSQGINSNYLLDQVTIRPLGKSKILASVRAIGGTRMADWVSYFKDKGRSATGGPVGAVRSGGGSTSASGTYTDEQTLTANMVNYAGPVASPAVGAFLELKIVQGSGPYTWTWDAAQFAADVPTNITDVNGGVTRIRFIRESDNLWHVTSWYSAA